MSVSNSKRTDAAQEKIRKLTEEIRILNEIIDSQEAALTAVNRLLKHNVNTKESLAKENEEACSQVGQLEDEIKRVRDECTKAEEEAQAMREERNDIEKRLKEEIRKITDIGLIGRS